MDFPQRAVFFLEEDSSLPAHSKPLMLEAVLFCPILKWMSDKLLADGVQRFFAVSSPRFAQEVRACFPEDADVTISEQHSELLDFLNTPDPVAVFVRAALPMEEAGPGFAYGRPGCAIGDDIKVGDFVEVKNSAIGDGTKISHLTYVGDSDVGRKVNFGCGTVTTNYDGVKKYRCTIEDGAFIGCNTNLVAPVTVGAGSYIAAGATITKDVPADALAVARAKQENKEGWAKRRRKLYGQEH